MSGTSSVESIVLGFIYEFRCSGSSHRTLGSDRVKGLRCSFKNRILVLEWNLEVNSICCMVLKLNFKVNLTRKALGLVGISYATRSVAAITSLL
jgi:hypothetical protein